MRPTIRPTAAEMDETEVNHIRSRVCYYEKLLYRDKETGERTYKQVYWSGFKDSYDETKQYLEEKRLIGLQMEESYWGDPKFILEDSA